MLVETLCSGFNNCMHGCYRPLIAALIGVSLLSTSEAAVYNGVSLQFSWNSPYGNEASNKNVSALKQVTKINTVPVRQYVTLDRYDDPNLEEQTLPSDADFLSHFDHLASENLRTAFTLGITLEKPRRFLSSSTTIRFFDLAWNGQFHLQRSSILSSPSTQKF